MRQFLYMPKIAKQVITELNKGAAPEEVEVDLSAPYLKGLLLESLALALSSVPEEKVLHFWRAPLKECFEVSQMPCMQKSRAVSNVSFLEVQLVAPGLLPQLLMTWRKSPT